MRSARRVLLLTFFFLSGQCWPREAVPVLKDVKAIVAPGWTLINALAFEAGLVNRHWESDAEVYQRDLLKQIKQDDAALLLYRTQKQGALRISGTSIVVQRMRTKTPIDRTFASRQCRKIRDAMRYRGKRVQVESCELDQVGKQPALRVEINAGTQMTRELVYYLKVNPSTIAYVHAVLLRDDEDKQPFVRLTGEFMVFLNSLRFD